MLRKNPEAILSAEEDIEVQASVTWGLDRIVERDLPLDNAYNPPSNLDGTGVDIYIFDTGVQTTHSEFTGRISQGADFTGEGIGTDFNGHETHVAGKYLGRCIETVVCIIFSQARIGPFLACHRHRGRVDIRRR